MQATLNAKPKGCLAEVREGVRIFANLSCILDKIDTEGTFSELAAMFERIFEKEILFTIRGGLTRTEPPAARLLSHPLHLGTLPQQHELPPQPGAHRRVHQ